MRSFNLRHFYHEGLEILTGFSRRTVRSTTDTLGVGTRKAMPVILLKQEVTSIRICLDCWKGKQKKPKRTSNT